MTRRFLASWRMETRWDTSGNKGFLPGSILAFLPRLLPSEIRYRFHVFEGKQGLEKSLGRKLRSYFSHADPEVRFIVMRDQDRENCISIKNRLQQIAIGSGHRDVLIRIVCRELESWYMADLQSVGEALSLPNLGRHQNKRQYRNPDSIVSPARELTSLTNGQYQKIGSSRMIGRVIDPANPSSDSFRNLVEGLFKITETSRTI